MDRKRINLRHLRAFREVARYRSISEASRHVHLSQPAITQAIAKLEDVLGTPLFERRSDGMFATPPGEIFCDRVDRALGFLAAGAADAIRVGLNRRTRGFSNFDQLLTMAQLNALIAVSHADNFSLAARACGLSQPSLHRTARDLERLSGIPLFRKTNRGIELTEAARALVRHAKLALAELDQGYAEVEALHGVDTGQITVGSMPLSRTFLLPSAITALTGERPEVQVGVVDGPYDDLLHGLRHGEIDVLIGALRQPPPIEDVAQEPLFDDPLAIVARSGHPLASKTNISLEELAGYPWAVPRRGTPTRDHFERLFTDADLPVPVDLVETSSLILIRGLLLDSDRLTIISAHQIRHEQETGLLHPLDFDMSGTERTIGLTVRRDWRPTKTQERFLDLLRAAGKRLRHDAV
ncbi:MAG: LysR family transcriptional regulator [Hyphomicrobiales bacterium]|nr:LysR family transcriptional regulator [Hyphomicrobiales bacterium]